MFTPAPKPESKPKERKPLQRGRPKRRNIARHEAEWARAYHSEAFVQWMQGLPSLVSRQVPCVVAHTRTGGMGRKADYCWTVPLTQAEHDRLHHIGKRSFESEYEIELDAEAKHYHALWLTASQGSL